MSEHKKEENKVGVLKPLTQPKPSGKKARDMRKATMRMEGGLQKKLGTSIQETDGEKTTEIRKTLNSSPRIQETGLRDPSSTQVS